MRRKTIKWIHSLAFVALLAPAALWITGGHEVSE
jgi:hypothetical protein